MNPTNGRRAAKARKALAAYKLERDGVRTALIDLLTDVRHLCDKEGFSLRAIECTADMHYKSERVTS